MPEPRTETLLWQCVETWAAKKPEEVAIVFGAQRVTWREFAERVDQAAKAFIELGVQPGDCVALVSMARPEFLYTFLAASKVGAMWLGLSPKFAVDELRYILGHCQPAVLITLREYMGVDLVEAGMTFGQEFPSIHDVLVIGETVDDVTSYAEFVGRPRPGLDNVLADRARGGDPSDEVLLMYTSGSSGKPKGVLHTHETVLSNVAVEVEQFGFSESSCGLLHFPINHVAADVEIGFAAVYAGARTVLMDRFDPQASLETIEAEGVTIVGQVPAMYLLQFQAPKFADMDWSRVEAFVWGGSAAPAPVLDALAGISATTGARLISGYGSTEVGGFVTYTEPEASRDALLHGAGKAVEPHEIRIVGPDRQLCSPGETGEIALRTPSLMKGYLNNTAQTAAVIDEAGWYYTGDLGSLDQQGHLVISGRATEMYKTGGENVFPREIEEVLERHPAVLFAAVIGRIDPTYDEIGHAFVMPKPGGEVDAASLASYCKDRLANFKVPKVFEIRPILPLLPNGKVDKRKLREDLANAS